MKYHALFVIFEKSGKILNCRLLQIIGGALRVKVPITYCMWKTKKIHLHEKKNMAIHTKYHACFCL